MSTLSSPDICLRPEEPGDITAIQKVNRSAFGTDVEADLVDALRASGAVTLSVVALHGAETRAQASDNKEERGGMLTQKVSGGEVIGHVLFTPVTVATEKGKVSLLGLGPVAVVPARQHQGVGTLMVSECLEHLRMLRHAGVVVIGEPSYYRRFGFIQADRWSLTSAIEVPVENFLALELRPGHLGGISGEVSYRPEFTPE